MGAQIGKRSRWPWTYRNTPIAGLGALPVMLLFGQEVKDLLTVKPGKQNMLDGWVRCKEARKIGMRHRYKRGK